MKLEKLRGQYTNVSVTLVTPNSEFVYSSLLPEVIGESTSDLTGTPSPSQLAGIRLRW